MLTEPKVFAYQHSFWLHFPTFNGIIKIFLKTLSTIIRLRFKRWDT